MAAMSKPETQGNLADFATSDDGQEAVSALTASVTAGAVEGIKRELLDPSNAQLVDGVGARSQSLVEQNIAPAVATVVARTIDGSLASMTSDRNLERTGKVVGTVTEAAVLGMTSAIAEGMRRDIGPAIRDLEEKNRSLATQLLADDDLRQAVGAMAHEISREVILGSEGALDTISRNEDPYEDGVLIGFLGGGIRGTLAAIAMGLLGGITLVMLIVLLVGRRRRIREAEQYRQREEMLMTLMRVMTSKEGMTSEQLEVIDNIVLQRSDDLAKDDPSPSSEHRGPSTLGWRNSHA